MVADMAAEMAVDKVAYMASDKKRVPNLVRELVTGVG